LTYYFDGNLYLMVYASGFYVTSASILNYKVIG